MKYEINNAVVIGAGTMGAALAAHLANAGVRVTLLDIVPWELTPKEQEKGLTLDDPEVRNRIVDNGLQQAINSRPASFFAKELVGFVKTGNLEDDFKAIASADWVIEAIIENLKIKQDLMARIDEFRSEKCIVSTNTSGIPVTSIVEGLSEGFRQHFLGTHFFNPPRYLKLLEIIPTDDTLPDVVDFISHFGEYRLGKGIVPCKDTPNFIGNRLLSGTNSFALHYILENDYTVEEVDAITGPPIGRPKTATFRLLDLVGIDVLAHVTNNLIPAIPHDEHALRYLKSEKVNSMFESMVEEGWLGNKTKVGFYKQIKKNGKKEFWPLNLKTLEHEPPSKPRFDSVGKAKDLESVAEKLNVFLKAEDRAGQLVRAITFQTFAYASELIPEIADTPKPMDDAMRWGFGHQAGPFETWDTLGVAEIVSRMEEAGFPPAPWVKEMLDDDVETFYRYEGERKVGVYNPESGEYETVERSPAIIVLKEQKDVGKLVSQNASASIVDLGDGVICVEFQTKMNALDEYIIQMLNEALDRTEKGEFEGIVLGNDGDHFCAGANVFAMVMAAQNSLWEQLDETLKNGQDAFMRIRYSPKPVVVAPVGYTFGGGCEIVMHGSRVVSAGELYIGQTEIGFGLIPAGGGIKELLRRIVNPAMRVDDAPVLPFMQKVFNLVGQAQVATSAVEARQFGFLDPEDRIVMNRDHLISQAKREVHHMLDTGYHPPIPEKIYAAGRDTLAALRAGVHMFKEGKYITEYESQVGERMIKVLTGGEMSSPTWVDEQYILDLEREAFLSLCGEEKTRERIWHFLRTGKMLRN